MEKFIYAQKEGTYMHTIIQGIPVHADPALSSEDMNKISMDLIRSWAWEGRPLGRIELIYDKKQIHIVTYEKPSSKVIPLNNDINEE